MSVAGDRPTGLYPTHVNREGAGGGIWVVLLESAFGDDNSEESVFQTEPRAGRIARRISFDFPVDVAVGFGNAWVLHED